MIEALCAGVVLAVLVTVAQAGFGARRQGAREELDATRARYAAFSLLEQVRAEAAMGIAPTPGSRDHAPRAWHLPETATLRETITPGQSHSESLGAAPDAALWEVRAHVRWPAGRSPDGTVIRWREVEDVTWIAIGEDRR